MCVACLLLCMTWDFLLWVEGKPGWRVNFKESHGKSSYEATALAFNIIGQLVVCKKTLSIEDSLWRVCRVRGDAILSGSAELNACPLKPPHRRPN